MFSSTVMERMTSPACLLILQLSLLTPGQCSLGPKSVHTKQHLDPFTAVLHSEAEFSHLADREVLEHLNKYYNNFQIGMLHLKII